MSRAVDKVAMLSRQLDVYQNFLDRLRLHKLMPIELKGDISEVMLKVREMERASDKSNSKHTKLY